MIRLLPVDELVPGEMRCIEVEPRRILLLRKRDGSFAAVGDSCAHQGARLSAGKFGPLVTASDIGQYLDDTQVEVIRCPRHGFEFDVDTGRCPADPHGFRIKVYRVSVSDGYVGIEP